jgi:hypothetical protein
VVNEAGVADWCVVRGVYLAASGTVRIIVRGIVRFGMSRWGGVWCMDSRYDVE